MLTRMMAGEMYTGMERRRSGRKTGEGISEGMKGDGKHHMPQEHRDNGPHHEVDDDE